VSEYGVPGPDVSRSPELPAGLRLRKSAEELDWLRRAAELTDLSCAALERQAAVGSTEYELAALVEGSYLPLGGTNYIHYFAVTQMDRPQQCVASQWPSGRQLGAGDVLSCELSTSYGVDYPGQLLRTFTVAAEPTPLVRELHAVAEALSRVEALLAPGVGAEEVVQAASVIEDARFTTVGGGPAERHDAGQAGGGADRGAAVDYGRRLRTAAPVPPRAGPDRLDPAGHRKRP
jgi:Xaa-Pro aminopeptidase